MVLLTLWLIQSTLSVAAGIKLYLMFRCATGEAWPSIMLSCEAGRPCDPQALINSSSNEIKQLNVFDIEKVRFSVVRKKQLFNLFHLSQIGEDLWIYLDLCLLCLIHFPLLLSNA